MIFSAERRSNSMFLMLFWQKDYSEKFLAIGGDFFGNVKGF
jgi:hypothetical protein